MILELRAGGHAERCISVNRPSSNFCAPFVYIATALLCHITCCSLSILRTNRAASAGSPSTQSKTQTFQLSNRLSRRLRNLQSTAISHNWSSSVSSDSGGSAVHSRTQPLPSTSSSKKSLGSCSCPVLYIPFTIEQRPASLKLWLLIGMNSPSHITTHFVL
jgi:hypothetical protein